MSKKYFAHLEHSNIIVIQTKKFRVHQLSVQSDFIC